MAREKVEKIVLAAMHDFVIIEGGPHADKQGRVVHIEAGDSGASKARATINIDGGGHVKTKVENLKVLVPAARMPDVAPLSKSPSPKSLMSMRTLEEGDPEFAHLHDLQLLMVAFAELLPDGKIKDELIRRTEPVQT